MPVMISQLLLLHRVVLRTNRGKKLYTVLSNLEEERYKKGGVKNSLKVDKSLQKNVICVCVCVFNLVL